MPSHRVKQSQSQTLKESNVKKSNPVKDHSLHPSVAIDVQSGLLPTALASHCPCFPLPLLPTANEENEENREKTAKLEFPPGFGPAGVGAAIYRLSGAGVRSFRSRKICCR